MKHDTKNSSTTIRAAAPRRPLLISALITGLLLEGT